MKVTAANDEVGEFKENLNRIRELSLAAARRNDFRTVARLTSEAARLNRAIHFQAGLDDRAAAVIDAIAGPMDSDQFVFPKLDEPVCEEAA